MKSFSRTSATIALCIATLFLLVAFPPYARAGNIFIVAGGTGSKSGSDWSNALPDLPDTPGPQCGNSYFVAGGTYNRPNTSFQTWTANCSANNAIFVYKAVNCGIVNASYCTSTFDPAKITGWQESYGLKPAIFVQPLGADLLAGASSHSFMQICGSYYTIDGVTPLQTPATSGFGFIWRNPNQGGGMIAVTSAPGACTTKQSDQLTHVTVLHSEFDGVDPLYGYSVASCNRSGNVVTLKMTTAPTGWLVGNNIDFQNNTPSDFDTGHSGYGVPITSINGSTITFSQAGPNEACSVPGYAVLNFSPGAAFTANFSSQHYDSISFSDNYIHDCGDPILIVNTTNFDFERNYVARNRSTFTQHESAIDLVDGGSFTSNGNRMCNGNGAASNPAGDCTIASNIFENIGGTQVVGMLGSPRVDDLRLYNNVAFCTDDAGPVDSAASPQCGTSRFSGDNSEACATNVQIIGNTFYGGAVVQDDYRIEYLNFKCSTTVIQNNLWYTNNQVDFNFGVSHVEDHNTVFGKSGATAGKLVAPSDYIQTSNFSNPFVSVAPPFDFRLVNDTIDPHISDGIPLPAPFDVDLLGSQRTGLPTWDRGAYAFDPVTTPPAAPTIVQVVVH